MSELKKSWSMRQVIIITALMYAINIALAYMQHVLSNEAFHGNSNGLTNSAMALCSGFFMAEIGCAVLWACLSTCGLPRRLLVYVAVAFQIAAISMGSQILSFLSFASFEYIAMSAVGWMTLNSMVLVFTLIASRLTQRRMRFVETELSAMGDSRSGVTIFQLIYLMTLVAIILAAYSYARSESAQASEYTELGQVFYMCFYAVASSGLTSIVLLASLYIVVWFGRLWLQLIVASVIGLVASYLTRMTFESEGTQFAYTATWILCMVIVPILWLAIVRRMGYVIRCFDREPTRHVDHPLIDDAVTMEPNR